MKIHILGNVCSGKTTLAKQLSEKLNIEYIELDNVIYNDNHEKNSETEINKKIAALLAKNNIITDSCHIQEKWIEKIIQNYDKVYVLKINFFVNIWRVFKRNRQYKKNQTPESLKHFFKMINRVFNSYFVYKKYYKKLNKLHVKYIKISSIDDISKDLNK